MQARKSCGGQRPQGANRPSFLHFKAPREVGNVGGADSQAAGAGGSAAGVGGRAAGAGGAVKVGARGMMIGQRVEHMSEAEAVSTEFVDVDCSAEELAEESGIVLARNMVQSTHPSIVCTPPVCPPVSPISRTRTFAWQIRNVSCTQNIFGQD